MGAGILWRAVAWTHRWLGIAGWLLFAIWFTSGIVMMYARMPELTRAERQTRLPPLDFSSTTVSIAQAARGDVPQRVRLGMLAGRPVYRLFVRNAWITVFADTGEHFERLTESQAIDEARSFAPEHASTIRYDARLVDPDQWTLQTRAQLPMHRVALGDPDDTVLYFSVQTGEAVVKPTRSERRIAYAGAVLHWLYLTPLRRHASLWTQIIIWTSVAGTLMCLLGLAWGIRTGLVSPYKGWLRWHHYCGLIFGVFSLTWVFSGLLSMDPWSWHPSTAPTRAQREAFAGGPLRLDAITLDAIRSACATSATSPGRAKEIEVVQFRGEPRLLVDGRGPDAIDSDMLIATARAAMPGVAVEQIDTLTTSDSYYYGRQNDLPLPVVRIKFADEARTWLYIDPVRGAVARREERLTRLNRWLYHGLHSLDFPFLYRRRPLWDAVVILLSLGGLASVATSALPAWRRLRRQARRLL